VDGSSTSSRIADVAVFVEAPTDLHRCFVAPGELELVVDVVAGTSLADDPFARARWHAAAGVPHYWRVESHPPDAVVFQFELATTADGASAYVQTGVTTLATLEAGQGSNL
jgi:hypothetical protein